MRPLPDFGDFGTVDGGTVVVVAPGAVVVVVRGVVVVVVATEVVVVLSTIVVVVVSITVVVLSGTVVVVVGVSSGVSTRLTIGWGSRAYTAAIGWGMVRVFELTGGKQAVRPEQEAGVSQAQS